MNPNLIVVKHAGKQQQLGMRRGKFRQNHPDARTIGRQVSRATDAGRPPCPNAVSSGPAPAGSCCAPVNRGCAGPILPRPLVESAPSSRIQTCCFACCNSTWTEKFGTGDFAWNSSHSSKRAPAFFRHAIGRALQFRMLEKIELQRHAGPQRRAHGQDGLESLRRAAACPSSA